MKSKKLFIILFVVLTLLTSCSKKETSETLNRDYGYAMESDSVYLSNSAAEEEVSYNSKAFEPSASAANTVPRMIQRSASLSISVLDPGQALDAIISMVDDMGGFVVTSATGLNYYGNISLPYANVTIRVPAENLNEAIRKIEDLTSDSNRYVSQKKISGIDITSDYVDSQSRLTSLEKTLNKLYEILDTATNTEDALSVYSEISSIESDIEVLKGQIKYMNESVSLASLDVHIESIKPDPIISGTEWAPWDTILNAWESLRNAGKGLFSIFIYTLIVMVPIAIVILLPLFFIIKAIRKLIRNKKNKTKKAQVQAAEPRQNSMEE